MADLARLIKEKDWWVAKFWIVIVISVILRRVTSNELRQSIYENNDYSYFLALWCTSQVDSI